MQIRTVVFSLGKCPKSHANEYQIQTESPIVDTNELLLQLATDIEWDTHVSIYYPSAKHLVDAIQDTAVRSMLVHALRHNNVTILFDTWGE